MRSEPRTRKVEPTLAFDYRTATADEIEFEGHCLEGRRLDELDTSIDLRRPSSAATKGVVGRVIEAYFGIEQNSRHEPDFRGAGIELKSVPIQRTRIEARAKERISLGMIDWNLLRSETWATATARQKLEHLMLVFYEWSPLRPMGFFKVLATGIWTPDPASLEAIEQDWMTIRQLEIDGRRGEASEGLTNLLGAATKGAGHGSTSRAWSLKQPFVGWIYRSMAGEIQVPMAIKASVDPAAAFERATLEKLRAVEGKAISEVATTAGTTVSRSKSAAANVIRTYMGEKSKGRSGDFERFGVEVKLVPIDAGKPVEATSFPGFIHEELAFESWEDSDLLGRLNRILFIPVERAKGQDQATARVGRAFFWSPPEDELRGIEVEWDRYRRLIAEGGAAKLPKASETMFIHVRPKGRDSTDRDLAPGGVDVIRKCFWLNQRYVARIIHEHGGSTR
jgi:DNA mismatch repair protein MutH